MIHEDNKSKELYDSIIANIKDWYKKFIKPEIKQKMKTAYYIQNKKEGKFIYKYLGINHKPFETGYVMKNNDSYQWSLQCPDDCDDTVSVKFLMSLDNQKLEKRISKLESKVEGLIKEKSPKSELTELPEKWCVRVNEDVLPYLNIHGVNAGKYNSIDKGSFTHFPKINNSFSTALTVKCGYTEISFSDFERLVLKKEQSNNIGQLEVGKWYKNKLKKCLACYSTLLSGYGFLNGEWCVSISMSHKTNWIPATKEEVEEALKNEAVKRGFKKGVTFKSAASGDEFILDGDLIYNESNNSLTGYMGCLFIEGKWAEIIQDNNKEIDWSIPGQKVIGNQEVIVLTSGVFDLSKEIFSGIIIQKGKCAFPVGYFSKNWDSKQFAIYTNPVTL